MAINSIAIDQRRATEMGLLWKVGKSVKQKPSFCVHLTFWLWKMLNRAT